MTTPKLADRLLLKLARPGPNARITLRRRLPVAGFVLLLLAAILFPSRAWNALLISLGGMIVAAYLWSVTLLHGLNASRRLRFGWVSVGDRLQEAFILANRSAVPALWVELLDDSNVPGYQVEVTRSAGPNQQVTWRASAVCQQRGRFQLGPWSIRSGDPFGLFEVLIHFPASQDIVITPPIHARLPIPLPQGESSGRVRAAKQSWQATLNAATVRDYRHNDPVNRVHWPTSARRGELFVREFDLDAAGDIWIVLDLRQASQLGSGAESTEEQAVLLAASLTARTVAQNRAVGLVAYGAETAVIPPARGRGQQWKLLQALAVVSAGGDAPLKAILPDLARGARRGAAAIIITATDSGTWTPQLATLRARGVQSEVVLLDRPSFGGRGNSEALRDAINRLGFRAHIVRRGQLGQPLPQSERQGFWEFRVTPSGKVITLKNPLGEGAR